MWNFITLGIWTTAASVFFAISVNMSALGVRPLSMDADQYDYYIQRGYEIKPETLKKLEDMRGMEPLMEELIEHMIKGKMGIEQECFLI